MDVRHDNFPLGLLSPLVIAASTCRLHDHNPLMLWEPWSTWHETALSVCRVCYPS